MRAPTPSTARLTASSRPLPGLAAMPPIRPDRPLPWRTAAAVVLGWDAAAALTGVMHQRGVVPCRVPYLTEVIHALPKPGRALAVGVISAAVADHLGARRVF